MDDYDPLQAPDPEEWLALDESERLELIKDYHRQARIRLPNLTLHGVIHAVVENQIALGAETPAQRTAARLMKEGLDRHEAIHAIGSVLMGNVFDMTKTRPADGDPNPPYFAELKKLSAKVGDGSSARDDESCDVGDDLFSLSNRIPLEPP